MQQDILKRILINKHKPEATKDLTPAELIDLVLVVLGKIKHIEGVVQSGILKGDPGETPAPGVDYLSKRSSENILAQAISEVKHEVSLTLRGIKNPKNGKNGKNGSNYQITSQDYETIAQIASDAIDLPDFTKLLTQEPTAIRNSLELLQGKERLSIKAIDGVDETLADVYKRIANISVEKGGGGGRSWLSALGDVKIDGVTNGQTLIYNTSSKTWGPGDGGGGSTISVNTAEVTDPDFTDTAEIAFGVATSTVTADLVVGSIDVLKLDAGVQASLALADTALQAGAQTLAGISLLSDDTAKSLYTMTSAVDVEFETSASSTLMYLDEANERVGIGTATPTAKLEVAGLVSQTGLGNSTYFGDGAGAVDDLSGNNNVGFGYQALAANTTGAQNSAQGYRSLYRNTTGNNNSAQGYRSLFSNTTGSQNSAQGRDSLYSNTTGNNNSAQGYNAGRYIADGATANATTSNSVYAGADTRASADGVTNENVFGYNAIGSGSNTVTLGNDDITDTILKGKVGIGTTPTAKLHVLSTTEQLRLGYDASNYVSLTTASDGKLTIAQNGTRFLHNTGSNNSFLGVSAGNTSLTAIWNTGIGAFSLDALTSGNSNTAIGVYALSAVQNGVENVGIGIQAGTSLTSGSYNMAVGSSALFRNSSGSNNLAIGRSAVYNSLGSNNVGLGFQALRGGASGVYSNNVAIGANSLFSVLAGGSNNVAIGYQSGYTDTPANALTTGTSNTFLGHESGFNSATQRDKAVAIGFRAKVDADNTMALGGTGVDAVSVVIGGTTANSTLQVVGSFATAYVAKTATYTATSSDHTIDCTDNTFTVTLPTAVGITGRVYVVKNSGTGTITVDGDGSETIDGNTSIDIVTQYDSRRLQSNGVNWIET